MNHTSLRFSFQFLPFACSGLEEFVEPSFLLKRVIEGFPFHVGFPIKQNPLQSIISVIEKINKTNMIFLLTSKQSLTNTIFGEIEYKCVSKITNNLRKKSLFHSLRF